MMGLGLEGGIWNLEFGIGEEVCEVWVMDWGE